MTEDAEVTLDPTVKAIVMMMGLLFDGAIKAGHAPSSYLEPLKSIADDDEEHPLTRSIIRGVYSALNREHGVQQATTFEVIDGGKTE